MAVQSKEIGTSSEAERREEMARGELTSDLAKEGEAASHRGDWLAFLLWGGCFLIMLAIALFDMISTFVRR